MSLDPSIITRAWWETQDNEERREAYRLRLKRWLKNAPPQVELVATPAVAEQRPNNISRMLRRQGAAK